MDQLVTPSPAQQLNYYIGRKYAPGATAKNSYLIDSSAYRNAYQLETGAAVLNPDGTYSFGATVEDFINILKYYGVDTSNLQNILNDDFKPADFKINLDKLVNYGQYYWLPNGPQTITLSFTKANQLYIILSKFDSGLSSYYDSNYFYISSVNNAIGKSLDGFPNIEIGRDTADTTLHFKIPLTPTVLEVQNQVAVPPASMIGTAINGQPYYGYSMGSKETLNGAIYTVNTVFLENHNPTFNSTSVLSAETFSLGEDEQHKSPTLFGGHPDINGVIHYHAYNQALLGDYLDISTHSKLLGYAFDGYPIYGPRGYANADGSGGVIRMTSSYRLVQANAQRGVPDGRYVEDYEYVSGLGTLDANNGRYAATPEYPNGTYAYFMSVDADYAPQFPYIMGPNWSASPLQQSGTIVPPNNAAMFDGVPTIDISRDIVGQARYSFNGLTFVNGLKIKFDNTAVPASYRNNEYYVEGVGTAIQLIPSDELLPNSLETPTSYTLTQDLYDRQGYDDNLYDGQDYSDATAHYITINRASQDRNPWSRSNRWFHYRVLEETSAYLDEGIILGGDIKAVRPIIEFDSNLALYNHARTSYGAVDIFDRTQTNAFINVEGKPSYISDGVSLQDGMRIVFSADQDPQVNNKVYGVTVTGIASGNPTVYTVTLPPTGSAPVPGPFVWTPSSSNQFSIAGDFTSKRLELKVNDAYLNPLVDFTSTVTYNPSALLNIALRSGGSGYTTTPNVTISDINGVGTSAQAIAIMSGVPGNPNGGSVVGIIITNPGTGYSRISPSAGQNGVTVYIDYPPIGGTPARAEATAIGLVSYVTIDLAAPSNSLVDVVVESTPYQNTIVLNEIATVAEHGGVWAKSGAVNKGKGFYFLNDVWTSAQNKTAAIQSPLFDLFDSNLDSIGDRTVYNGSTFNGSELFSYQIGVGANDTVLGFPLSYRSVGLTGDILFDWNHSTDVFAYTTNQVTLQLKCESFYALDTASNTLRAIVSKNAALDTLPAMDLRYINTPTNVIDLKAKVFDNSAQNTVLVELNDVQLYRGTDYDLVNRITTTSTASTDKNNVRLVFRNPLNVNDKLLITQWTNDDITNTDLSWRLPLCLTTNPANTQISSMTFSQMQAHLVSGAQLLRTFNGIGVGDNNLFSEPNLAPLCSKFGYQNGNVLLAMALLKNGSMGLVESLQLAKDEFTKFKNTLIINFNNVTFDDNNQIPSMLDGLIQNYVSGKTNTFPYYDSDMVPGYTNFVATDYKVTYSQQKTYPIGSKYSNSETSRTATLVYHNGVILTRFRDYDFDANAASFTIVPAYPLAIGDTITVREYSTTTGNWIAPTPAKFGLEPVFQPGVVVLPYPKNNAIVNIPLLQGHDGSLVTLYSDTNLYLSTGELNDQRDLLMLELENRIFNNIKRYDTKLTNQILDKFDPLAGYYRSTAIDLKNTNNIMNRFFGQWILKSRLDFTTNNTYKLSDNWTWNYRGQQDVYGKTLTIGNWYGLYQYYFDTVYPHLTPWEMLGFTTQPDWWVSEYGPAPYTNQNYLMWSDIEHGIIRQGYRAGVDRRYIRTVAGNTTPLVNIIPVDSNGNMLSPVDCGLVTVVDNSLLSSSWIYGDGAPVEQAWIRSSEYPFSKQLYSALIDPRFYFGAAFDVLDSKIDPISGSLQRIYDSSVTDIGSVIRASDITSSVTNNQSVGYFSWVQARAQALNIDPLQFQDFATGIVPRLMYRMTGYSDQQKVEFYINSVAPGSTNSLSLLPNNNYQLLLYQSSPTYKLVYSGVTVTKTSIGWTVGGYDNENTYFVILPSIHNKNGQTIRVGGNSASYIPWASAQHYVQGQIVLEGNSYYKVLKDIVSNATFVESDGYAPLSSLPTVGGITATYWNDFSLTPNKISYGTVFSTAQEVFDFLIGYGRYLSSQGFIFNEYNSDLGETQDWTLSGKEFLFWTLQNWNTGAVLTLSPSSQNLQMYIPQGDLDSLYGPYADPHGILDQNGYTLKGTDLAVDRNFDLVSVAPISSATTIFLLKTDVIENDHLAIFDLVTDFNDVIFDPTTGDRQQRLHLVGSKSNGWNGKLFSPGYTIDNASVQEWAKYTNYNVGDLAKYNGIVYVANTKNTSGELFNYTEWDTLIKQPYQHLQANLDTMTSMMSAYYHLDYEQVASQESLYARHLIGYQPRKYLQELLVNDETQFKFYQGLITQKGTEAAVYALLRGSNPGGIPQVDIKSDWGLRVGELGLADNTNDVEVALDSDNLAFPNVMLDFTDTPSTQRDIIPVSPSMIQGLGELTTDNLFPVTGIVNNAYVSNFEQKYAGYARLDQVNATVVSPDLLPTVNSVIANTSNNVIWVAKTQLTDSQMYMTEVNGPFNVTVLNDNVLQLNSYLLVLANDPIWFNFDSANYDASVASLVGYQTVNKVLSNSAFSLTGKTLLKAGVTFTTFITRLRPVEFDNFNVKDINVISNITSSVPTQLTFATKHKYTGREKIVIDSVLTPYDVLNGKVYYVKVISNTKVALYYDQLFTDPVNTSSILVSNGYGPLNYVNSITTSTPLSVQSIFSTSSYENGSKIYLSGITWSYLTGLNNKYYYVQVVDDSHINLFYDKALTRPVLGTDYPGPTGYPAVYTVYEIGGTIYNYPNNLGTVYTSDINTASMTYELPLGQRLWVDNYVNSDVVGWSVFKKQHAWPSPFNKSILAGSALQSNSDLLGQSSYSWSYGASTSWLAASINFPTSDPADTNQGVVVFERSSNLVNLNPVELLRGATIERPGILPINADCSFGYAIATLDENTLLIGCPTAAGLGLNQGAVQIWTRDIVMGWQFATTVTAPGGGNNWEFFGTSLLRINDKLALIGAPGHGPTGPSGSGGSPSNLYRLDKIGDAYVVTLMGVGTSDLLPGFASSLARFGNYVLTVDPENNQLKLYNLSYFINSAVVKLSGTGLATGDKLYFDSGFIVPAELTVTVNSSGLVVGVDITYSGLRTQSPDVGVIFPDRITDSADNPKTLSTSPGFDLAYGIGDLHDLYSLPGSTAIPILENAKISITQNGSTVCIADSSGLVPGGVVRIQTLNPGIYEGIVDSNYLVSNGVTQYLTPPNYLTDYSTDTSFGYSLVFSDNGKLLVGQPTSPVVLPTTFDSGATLFDNGTTQYQDTLLNYGAVHSYGWYNTNEFVWEDTIVNTNPYTTVDSYYGSGFGTAIAQNQNDIFISNINANVGGNNCGVINEFRNSGDGWLQESQQQPTINVELMNRALTYDPVADEVVNFISFWDPIKGVHDSNALVNLDYVSNVDPGIYQSSSPGVNYWADERVGTTWWDTSASTWVWYEQGELAYRLSYWGSLFPGSFVRVCEWISSSVIPAAYNVNNINPELGQPVNGVNQPYTTVITRDSTGANVYTYYFWVENKQTVAAGSSKTLSASAITNSLITGPDEWVAAASPTALNTQALQNDLVNGKVVLQVEVLNQIADKPKHVEWALVSEGNEEVPPQSLVSKMIDSLCGADSVDNPVPDPRLPIYKQYGVSIRPRQSMFKDRVAAIETSTEYLNNQLATLILEDVPLGPLEMIDPIPLQTIINTETFDASNTIFDHGSTDFVSVTTNWNQRFNTFSDIITDYLVSDPVGYKVLVVNDENYDNLWTIYMWDGTQLILTNVQKYDTTRYWSRVDYYSISYPLGSIPDLTLATEQEFINGNYQGKNVKVLGPGYWRVLTQDSSGNTVILAMENGTIQINLTANDFNSKLSFDSASFDAGIFDPEPSIELRNILDGVQNIIFTGQNAYLWNSWFFVMVRYALLEQKQLDWAFKSSFIRVLNNVATLTPRPIYALDLQDSLENYISEVKPYHTKIREYTAAYTGSDQYSSMSTDFDCPPNIVNGISTSVDINDPAQSSFFENTWPWRAYRDGRSYEVVAVVIIDGGSGYTSEPTITFSGGTTVTDNPVSYPTANALLGISPQTYNTLGDNNYFSFRKVWIEGETGVDGSDITLQQYPLPDKQLLSSMVGNSPYAVKRIVVTDSGMGFLSPPDVIISGGGGTGARAYAVLGDTSARMLRTGLKFDRVKGTSNILYKDVRDPALDNPGFDTWHAAERIAAYYDPQPGQASLPQRVTRNYTITELPISDIALSGTSATIKFTLDHGFVSGQKVVLQNWVPAIWDNTYTITVLSAKSISINSIGSNQGPSGPIDPVTYPTVIGSLLPISFEMPLGYMYADLLQVAVTDSSGVFNLADPSTYIIQDNKRLIEFIYPLPLASKLALILNPPLLGLMKGADFDKTKLVGPKFGTGPGFDFQTQGFDGTPFDTWDLDPSGGFVAYGDIDTYQQSGMFVSAGGYDPSQEIVSDGSDFLNPDTIPSTEELLSGQIFDTVDITVYQKSGLSQDAHIQSLAGDPLTLIYPLNLIPESTNNVTVFVNGLVVAPEHYYIDYVLGNLVFQSLYAPPSDSIITVATTADGGPGVLQVQNFIGDGNESVFLISDVGPPNPLIVSVVTVGGTNLDPSLYTVTNTGINNSDLTFTLNTAPGLNAPIRIVVYEQSTIANKDYVQSYMQTITTTGATAYILTNPSGIPEPTSATTVVYLSGEYAALDVGTLGKRLRPADTAYYIANGLTNSFLLPECPGFDRSTLNSSEIQVAINGVVTTFNFNVSISTVFLSYTPALNDVVTVTVLTSGDYYIALDYANISNPVPAVYLTMSGWILADTTTELLVNTYNDTAINNMRTEVFSAISAHSVYYTNYQGYGIYGFGVAPIDLTSITTFANGQVKLSYPITDTNQASVFKNGRYLVPGQQWYVEEGSRSILNIEGGLSSSDTLVVHYFGGSGTSYSIAFRTFKDMLGRVNYYRIAAKGSGKVAQSVGMTDTSIYVRCNGTQLAAAPGKVMIGAELVVYRTLLGTADPSLFIITDLRRGVLGTAVMQHDPGTFVTDMTDSNLIPASDILKVNKKTTDGVTFEFNLPVVLEVSAKNANAISVYLGGVRLTSNYNLITTNGYYTGVNLSYVPTSGITVLIVVKQSSDWYDLNDPAAGLSSTNTVWAEFIRATPAPILFRPV